MRLTLKTKFVVLVSGAAVAPVLVSCVLILVQTRSLKVHVNEEMQQIANSEAGQIAQVVYRMCQMTDRQNQRRLEELLSTAHGEMDRVGKVSFAEERILWQARNQDTRQTQEISLPALRLGNLTITPNPDLDVPSPVVDAVTRYSGRYCTLFQRVNEEGEMLRVATTVPAGEGKRAIGTFIPSRTVAGLPNPVLAKVLAGQTFLGRAKVLDEWHAAAYEPLWDSPERKRVVGMLYVGFPLSDIHRELREAIMGITVGKTGYVYVLGAKGEQRGRYLISKGGTRDGESLWEATAADGHPYVQSLVNKALGTADGGVVCEHYEARGPGGSASRRRMEAVTQYAPWEWVIIAGMYEDDYSVVLSRVSGTIRRLLLVSTLGGAGVMCLGVGLALVLGAAMAKPIQRIITLTQTIAQGNLAEAREAITRMRHDLKLNVAEGGAAPAAALDEPSQLLSAVSMMTRGLSSLVSQVQRSSVQLVATATEIAATSRQQEGIGTDLSSSTTQVAASAKAISATTQALAQTMQDVQVSAAETERFADSGRAGLEAMAASMRQLGEATAGISSRLAVIKEKANSIDLVVTTIAKVADQTNLLSLNASIEAEKAGEYGRGFSVVAREIGRLADQTAVSTLEIEKTVKEMRASVTAGVMEMDKFANEVTQGVQAVEGIGTQLSLIIEHVKELTPRFEKVNGGMRSQSEGAVEISEAMVHLSAGAQRTAESLKQFNVATDQLKAAARDLQRETTRFKV